MKKIIVMTMVLCFTVSGCGLSGPTKSVDLANQQDRYHTVAFNESMTQGRLEISNLEMIKDEKGEYPNEGIIYLRVKPAQERMNEKLQFYSTLMTEHEGVAFSVHITAIVIRLTKDFVEVGYRLPSKDLTTWGSLRDGDFIVEQKLTTPYKVGDKIVVENRDGKVNITVGSQKQVVTGVEAFTGKVIYHNINGKVDFYK